ncbi:CHAT domain-containing protein [Boletus edulis]|nr:CHAT domain-containing protein [Boletus edulis]
MASKLDAREKGPQVESRASQSRVPNNTVQAPSASDADLQCTKQEFRGKEEAMITNIRATDVVLGLRRFPASFYTVVRHSGLEWRTENKLSSVQDDAVEWNNPLPIVPRPSDPSATVCLEVYASFECQPMLGTGEQLRKLTTTVKQLLDSSENHIPFTFFPKDGDIVSPCSSIVVTVERRDGESSDSLASWVLDPFCSTTDVPDELEDATNDGHSARRPPTSNRTFTKIRLRNLGAALLWRFNRLGELSDLEDAISTLRDASVLTPDGHPDKLGHLNTIGHSFITRFQRLGELRDLEDAISTLRDAVALTPHGHPDKPGRLNNLGLTLRTRFERFGELSDLEDAMSAIRDAVLLMPHGHPHKLNCLINLGSSSTIRFQRLGELSDLEDAISTLRDAVVLSPHGHPNKPSSLNNLGNSFRARFEHLGELSDLEDAISTYRDAVLLTPHGHPDKSGRLNNLGLSFRARFERLGELSDLEDAISTLRDAVVLTPHGHPDKSGRLSNLGLSFRARFECLGELSDLEHAISTLRDAVLLTPHGHPDKPCRLNNLGSSFGIRFQRLGELSDLEDAISTLRDASVLTPDGHPDKPSHLNNLGLSFRARFERLWELNDLEDAISTLRDAVLLMPHGHPDKLGRLNSLGLSFRTRFGRLGELRDLEDAISTYRDAVVLTPHGHPDRPGCLNNLGLSFIIRFLRLGELSDLEDAMSAIRDAVALTPQGHPDKPDHLNSLGLSFISRFKRLGELRDIEDAISALSDAVVLTPHGHPEKPGRLNNLGNSFSARFDRLGELSDLEDVISTYRDAVVLTPHGHPHKSCCLNNLARSFRARFKRLGELSDLEDAISTCRDAVAANPHGHPDNPRCLNSLGLTLRTRFECLGELSDLEGAISTLRDAVVLTPRGHPDKPSRLNNLGSSFGIRFQRLGELSDLEDALSTLRDASVLMPDGHPDNPSRLNNLGLSFIIRFQRLGELRDLEDALSTLRDAVVLTPHGHPLKLTCLNNLGLSFITRFNRLGELSDLENAISLYSHSASVPTGPISVRFRASRNWISCARRMHHPSLLRAYSIAINLFPQLAWIGLSLTHRYAELKRDADVVREAVAAALDSGLPELAVEWLEQGHSIVWGELLQLRGSYEQLSSAHPDHARRLRELSAALDDAGATREQSLSNVSESTDDALHRPTRTLQQDTDRHRKLAIERDKLLQEIRRLPGFERFLLPKDFPQLRASAHSGPVIMLNAAETRCDALIVLADVDHVIHVPLPSFDFQWAARLQNTLRALLGHARITRFDDRKGKLATEGGGSWESLLSTLWNGIVKPVLDALAFSTLGDLSRIFWCPTGPFVSLPIHAAGLYGTQYSSPGHKVSDFLVSSYIPTLSILAQSPSPSIAPSGDLRLLFVPQPPSDGQNHLQGVARELKHISTVVRNSPSARTTLLESSVGTVEEVLGLMKDADWVHFACHGIQDAAKPTDSGLCLANGQRLKISDIIGLSRSRGGLAFLSACQTATGDEGLSESRRGNPYRSGDVVCGLRWSDCDWHAPIAAREVYKYLFRNGTRPDYRDAARALHEAVGSLRESGDASFLTWVPFIHMVHESMIDSSESSADHVHSKDKRDERRPRSRYHKYWPRRAVSGAAQRLSMNMYGIRWSFLVMQVRFASFWVLERFDDGMHIMHYVPSTRDFFHCKLGIDEGGRGRDEDEPRIVPKDISHSVSDRRRGVPFAVMQQRDGNTLPGRDRVLSGLLGSHVQDRGWVDVGAGRVDVKRGSYDLCDLEARGGEGNSGDGSTAARLGGRCVRVVVDSGEAFPSERCRACGVECIERGFLDAGLEVIEWSHVYTTTTAGPWPDTDVRVIDSEMWTRDRVHGGCCRRGCGDDVRPSRGGDGQCWRREERRTLTRDQRTECEKTREIGTSSATALRYLDALKGKHTDVGLVEYHYRVGDDTNTLCNCSLDLFVFTTPYNTARNPYELVKKLSTNSPEAAEKKLNKMSPEQAA